MFCGIVEISSAAWASGMPNRPLSSNKGIVSSPAANPEDACTKIPSDNTKVNVSNAAEVSNDLMPVLSIRLPGYTLTELTLQFTPGIPPAPAILATPGRPGNLLSPLAPCIRDSGN